MVRWLVALVLFLAVAVFAVQNGQGVHLAYLGMTAPAVPLAYLILASLVLGAAVTVLLGSVQLLRLRGRLLEAERRLTLDRASVPAAAVSAPPAPDAPPAHVPAPETASADAATETHGEEAPS